MNLNAHIPLVIERRAWFQHFNYKMNYENNERVALNKRKKLNWKVYVLYWRNPNSLTNIEKINVRTKDMKSNVERRYIL